MNTPTPSDLARLHDLAVAYRDTMHLDNIIEGSDVPENVQKASNTNVHRAAHAVAQAAAEILIPEFPPKRKP